MRLALKNTAPGFREPGGGQHKARRALLSNQIIQQSQNYYKYNLLDLLPVENTTWTIDDISRVKNAVISYCQAMDAGDAATMSMAAGMLQRIAEGAGIDQPLNGYAHSDFRAGRP